MSEQRNILLVVGPESSGTRIMASVLSSHPQVLGSDQGGRHSDALEHIWSLVNDGYDAASSFRALEPGWHLTRRSMPHSSMPGAAARFMEFPALGAFLRCADEAGVNVVAVVTTRSPAAHLGSWTASRRSVRQDAQKAVEQYHKAYTAIFAALADRVFYVTSLEGLTHEGAPYLGGLLGCLGLDPMPAAATPPLDATVNSKHYGVA